MCSLPDGKVCILDWQRRQFRGTPVDTGTIEFAQLSVEEALDHLFALVAPLPSETVALPQAAGRVLSETVYASRDQPPFAASSMDGYAVLGTQVAPGAQFTVIGEAAAGHGWSGRVAPGQAIRIFTGAPMPAGTDRVVIQEEVTRNADTITLAETLSSAPYMRPKGCDFVKGAPLTGPRRLTPAEIALLAAMNIAEVPVTRAPQVALISTGDELVMPGTAPGPDQIVASNTFGLAALLRARGAHPRILPIARDNAASLKQAFALAQTADLIVSIGGASVGDHDLVAPVAAELGMAQHFYKVAMRPGKPLMAGKLGGIPLVGLPGNPVSALVCGTVFLSPMIDVMLGLPAAPAARRLVRLSEALPANGPRAHYMRANCTPEEVRVTGAQDSALLHVLAASNALIIRPPHDAARKAGEEVEVMDL